jgi:xanthine dehydrogenase YagR molybdenum-binding subunit
MPKTTRRLFLFASAGLAAGAAAVLVRGGHVLGVIRSVAGLVPGRWLPGPGGHPDPLAQRHGLIGAPLSRLDGPLKVRGAAPFAAEFPMKDMLYAAFVFSTIAKGRIKTLDTGAAERAPGVALVMTHQNAPPVPGKRPSGAAADQEDHVPIMKDDRIYWNGQPIAVVLAESQEEADYAASQVRATYDVESATTVFDDAKAHTHHELYFGEPLTKETGNAEAALAAARFRVDQTYRTPFQNHNAMELHAATMTWSGDKLIVHDCTQGVTQIAQVLAKHLGLKENQVQISAPYVGGAFGGK